ncbi:MAG: succinyl-diaminopimelate desuccinylase [Gammaproteobacteria bacterium]|nr:succinyl-diaminopimelate desuccinylase [Gammaproteobacteria bacterium]MBU1414935.1 succinyl-diaminopimelate desuccinylase [Gammaproteobacteria bacterium]
MAASPTLALARELIALPSATPDDAGCLEVIAKRLAPLGFALERIDCNGVSNLWARRGNSAPLICFAGHTDVVPPGPLDQWRSPPFVPTERDGFLFGRGAADMKSSIAAFVFASERFIAEHADHAGSLALLLTSDEEGDAVDGTVRVVETLKARGESIDYCIVGEPTCSDRFGDTIKNGRRGSLSARLIVKGVQGHVAYPEKVRNPIHLAAPALAELAATRWDEGNEYFPPTSFQIANIHAGTGAPNVVPGALEAFFNFRFSTESPVEHLQEAVHALLDRHDLEYEIHWTISGRPYLTPRGRLVDALAGAIAATTGVDPVLSTSGGTSDGRFIADICPEVAEFGPLNASIHKVDEHVSLVDLESLTGVYRSVLDRLLVA